MSAQRSTSEDSEQEKLRRRARGLAILLEVSKTLAATLQLEEVLQAATDGVTRLFELKTAAVYLGEGDILRLWATTPLLPPEFPEDLRVVSLADHPHLSEAMTSGAPVFLPDTASAELTPAEAAVTALRGLRSVLYLPLTAGVKRLGTLIVGSVGEPARLSDAEIDSCATLANLAALAVQNAQLYTLGRQYVTDLEQRIAEREQTERALRESEERLRLALTAAEQGLHDLKEAEDERARLAAQLLHAQKMESVGRLAGGVAHDFNNMLLVILACTELIKMRHHEDTALLTSIEEIERAALRARDMTRQLLAISRKQAAMPRPLNLSELLTETHRTLGRLIGEDIALRFQLSADLWPVRIDPSQVDQILMNLVVNARDAMPMGGKLTIETTNVRIAESYCRQHVGFQVGDYVLLAVTDSGTGMDHETLAHVFEPFFTTKAIGKGSGLGLATVHGIVAQNGGVAAVSSEPGLGTTFRIYLPRSSRSQDTSIAAGTAPDAPPHQTGGTILLAEDDEAVRRLMAATLDALGFGVLVAPGWREALVLAGREDVSVDLLLTDVVMPELSGKELWEQLRALRPRLPVLYMSGYTADVIAHHGILEEGVNFIQKPFTMDDLARAIRKALQSESA